MTRPMLRILAIIGLLSCNSSGLHKKEREGEPTIYSVKDDDKEMNNAITTANATLTNFNDALKSNNPNFSNFAIKTRFTTLVGAEHIWVSKITLTDNEYFGIIDNLPESTTDVKIGDTIQINKDDISDWLYVANGKLQGGYTIRLLRSRMTSTEKKQFDTEYGVIIEE